MMMIIIGGIRYRWSICVLRCYANPVSVFVRILVYVLYLCAGDARRGDFDIYVCDR